MNGIKELLLKNGYMYNSLGQYFWHDFNNTCAFVFVQNKRLGVDFVWHKEKAQDPKDPTILTTEIEKKEDQVQAFIDLVKNYNLLYAKERTPTMAMNKIETLFVKAGYTKYEGLFPSFYKSFNHSIAVATIRQNDIAISLVSKRMDEYWQDPEPILSMPIEKTEEQAKEFISLVDSYNRLRLL